ncbi:unnamed protein product [Penicillium salamii]|nr:unnamed protein product [Penicillium salamii]
MATDDTRQHLPADDSSSIYSHSTQCPEHWLPYNSKPIRFPLRHDLPEINYLDHQIALTQGSTMALETTRTRLKYSKSESRLSFQELREKRICQQNQQKNKNKFYHSCFKSLLSLTIAVFEISQDLMLQYHFEPEISPLSNNHMFQAIRKLFVAVEQSQSQEAQAEQA